MIFDQNSSYYDVLEVRPDASALEIRNAYQRLKDAYRKGNVALYSVLDSGETDEMQAKIEEAYHILSDPESRRDYDERHGIHFKLEDKIVSIDRVPPMESAADENDLLIPPTTDFPLGTGQSLSQAMAPRETTGFIERRNMPNRRADPPPPPAQRPANVIEDEIAQQTDWRGAFLKRIREIRRMSVDDVATQTKISKTYIHAIEEEAFEKLPAAVFVRGFVVQIAKILKLPTDQVAQAYMSRYKR